MPLQEARRECERQFEEKERCRARRRRQLDVEDFLKDGIRWGEGGEGRVDEWRNAVMEAGPEGILGSFAEFLCGEGLARESAQEAEGFAGTGTGVDAKGFEDSEVFVFGVLGECRVEDGFGRAEIAVPGEEGMGLPRGNGGVAGKTDGGTDVESGIGGPKAGGPDGEGTRASRARAETTRRCGAGRGGRGEKRDGGDGKSDGRRQE